MQQINQSPSPTKSFKSKRNENSSKQLKLLSSANNSISIQKNNNIKSSFPKITTNANNFNSTLPGNQTFKNQHFLNRFIQTKITEGLKLNKLNEINSIHSSVYNNSTILNDKNKEGSKYHNQESMMSNNTMKNVINLSYFNNSNYESSQVMGIQNRKQKLGKQDKRDSLLSNKMRSRSLSQFSMDKNKVNSNNKRQQSSNKNNNQATESPNKISEAKRLKQKNQLSQLQKKQLKTSSLPLDQQIQTLFISHYQRKFIKDLISFMNKNWSQNQNSLLQQQRIQMLINIIVQKFSYLNDIINDFVSNQLEYGLSGFSYGNKGDSYMSQDDVQSVFSRENISSSKTQKSSYTPRQIKLLTSMLFKQCQTTISNMRKLFQELISKLPQDGITQQQYVLQQLKKSLLQIYDPKYTYSSTKMKERFTLYYESFCSKKTSLETQIKHKLKPQLFFIKSIEQYLGIYQKELIKMKAQIGNLQKEKEHIMELLRNKTTFKPIQIDFKQLAELKEQAKNKIKKDFDENIVEFHKRWHEKDAAKIQHLKQEYQRMKAQVEQKQKQKQYHIGKLQDYLNSIPKKKDASTQIFNLPMLEGQNKSNNKNQQNQTSTGSPNELMLYTSFLHNIITPFTFNQKIASALISVISVDKILYDYQPIKHKLPLLSFKHYLFEWFIIRTGSKKVSQILLKNFIYSIKKYRNKHKRFSMFNKIIGFSGLRKKNLQQDIQSLFYQTQLAWYYLIKLALTFRKKLNDNPSGYHIYPPINCQQIFKLSLRKSYQLIEQFFTQQGITVPQNLSQKIDHYAINQISKFKQNDQQFQKQSLQQIHILRQMNFDIIAGFILDYIASQKAIMMEGLLRSIYLKQQQDKSVIGYSEFETIYRKYHKEKRSKIQLIYSKFCLCNMHDVLNAENMMPVILLVMEDQAPLRTIFQKNQSLKALSANEKSSSSNISPSKTQKKNIQPVSATQGSNFAFEHFRQRYYQQFYDFYDVTIMLQQIFKIVRVLIKKKLKKLSRQQKYIQSLLEIPKVQQKAQQKKQSHQQQQSQSQQQQSQEQQSSQQKKKQLTVDKNTLMSLTKQKSYIQQKLQEWNKIYQRVPHFTNNILTIDQIVIHNMRRKQMFQGCEFAWRTLREILGIISA